MLCNALTMKSPNNSGHWLAVSKVADKIQLEGVRLLMNEFVMISTDDLKYDVAQYGLQRLITGLNDMLSDCVGSTRHPYLNFFRIISSCIFI